jgi:hypothetical protein
MAATRPAACARCGSTTAPLVWSSKSGFRRQICANVSGCRRRRSVAKQRAATPRAESRKLRELVGVRLTLEEHARGLALAQSLGLTLPGLFRALLRDRLAQVAPPRDWMAP